MLAITIAAAALVAYNSTPAGEAETAFLQTPRALPELRLRNARTGSVFSHQQLAGRWTLIYSGYLNCPDLCPTTTRLFAELIHELAPHFAARGRRPPQFALLSIDHYRDRPEDIANYTQAFDPAIIPLTGAPDALIRTTEALGFIAPPKRARTNVAHSSAIALIGPNVRLQALFRHPHVKTDIATTLLDLPFDLPFDSPSIQEPTHVPNSTRLPAVAGY